jgi:hypothetical protein
LAGGHEVTINSLLPTMGGASHDQRELLRCCFDLVCWLDQQTPTAQQLETYLREQFPDKDPKEAIAQFFVLIQQSEIRKLFCLRSYQEMHLAQFTPAHSLGIEANRLEVQTARRFSRATDSGLLDGVIDRLVLIYEGDRLIGADLIDLKSEQLTSPALQSKVEFYGPQLEAYRATVAELTRLPMDKIAVRMVFLQSGQIVNYAMVEMAVDDPAKAWRPTSSKRKHGPNSESQKRTTEPEPPAANPATIRSGPLKSPRSASPNNASPGKPNISPSKGSPYRQQRLWDD